MNTDKTENLPSKPSIKLPDMVLGVKVTDRENKQFTKALGNWHKCREFLAKRKVTELLIKKLLLMEMLKTHPREGVLRNLIQRYSSVRRTAAENELDKFILRKNVAQIRKNQRGPNPKTKDEE